MQAAAAGKRFTPESTLSLTPPSDDDPVVKRRRSVQDPERAVHDAANHAYETVLGIFSAVKRIPVAKWSSLVQRIEGRMPYTRQLFEIIIQGRCPSFSFQDPVDKKEEGGGKSSGSSNSLVDTSPSTTPKKPKAELRKLVGLISKLVDVLSKYQKHLCQEEKEDEIQALESYENLVFEHYQPKVPELDDLAPPESDPPRDLLVKCPRHVFKLLGKIEAHLLYQENQRVQSSCGPLLELAQQIHDHYQTAIAALPVLERTISEYKSLQDILLTQLLDAKEQRRYLNAEAARKRLNKVQVLCEEQQKRLYLEDDERWEKLAFSEQDLSLLKCTTGTLCGFPFAMHAERGKKNANKGKPSEDMVGAVELSFKAKEKEYVCPCFYLMDGHGGNKTAQHCKEKLPGIFTEELQKNNNKGISPEGILNAGKATCLQLHKDAPSISGATLIFVLLIDDQFYLFSMGDSRGLVIAKEPLPYTCDASAKEPYFAQKVALRHGFLIEYQGTRVQGRIGLNLTQSIGDKLDAQFFLHHPFERDCSLPQIDSEDDVILLLCSDGVSDVVSDRQLLKHIRELEAKGIPLEGIASSILSRAWKIWNEEFGDDVSIILVRLRGKKKPESLTSPV